MLSITNLKKSYGDRLVLKGVNLDAQPGELTALLGQNGAGKSTLLNIIVGSQKADEGAIALFNDELTHKSIAERALLIAFLQQDPKMATAKSLTVMENFALAMLKGHKARLAWAMPQTKRHIIVQHFALLSLDESLLDKPMASLSGGQRQILAFAMAVLKRPSLLLFDEPTAALDEAAAQQLMMLIKQFIATWHIPCIMICHDKELVNNYADKAYMMQEGKVTRTGPISL